MKETKEVEIPNPGSDEAIAMNCSCPILDNGHGKGYARLKDGSVLFVMTVGCPIHIAPDVKL